MCLQVYLTGIVPLAIRPVQPRHVDFNQYYVLPHQLRRFADKLTWHDAIFAHLEHEPELLMVRLWQCVEANYVGDTAPSLDDLITDPAVQMRTSHSRHQLSLQTIALLVTLLLTGCVIVLLLHISYSHMFRLPGSDSWPNGLVFY